MTIKENKKNLGTLSLTVLKISQKNAEWAWLILETTVTFEFRPENALDLYNFLKMDLLNIP